MSVTFRRLLALSLFVAALAGCADESGNHAVTPPEGTPKLKVPAFAKEKESPNKEATP